MINLQKYDTLHNKLLVDKEVKKFNNILLRYFKISIIIICLILLLKKMREFSIFSS